MSRRFDGVLAGTAAGNQYVERAVATRVLNGRTWKLVAQVPFDARWLASQRCLQPTGIRHVLILAPNLLRYGVVDRCQYRNGVAKVLLLPRFPQLLINQGFDGPRPGPAQDFFREWQRAELTIG